MLWICTLFVFASQLSVLLVELPYLDKPPMPPQARLGADLLVFGVAYVVVCRVLLCTRGILLRGIPGLSIIVVDIMLAYLLFRLVSVPSSAGKCGTDVACGNLQVLTRCAY